MIVLMLACSPVHWVEVTEAFDVPPPPSSRTLRLRGPHAHPVELGMPLRLRSGAIDVLGDVVDHVDDPPEIVVYVPELVAQSLIDGARLRVP